MKLREEGDLSLSTGHFGAVVYDDDGENVLLIPPALWDALVGLKRRIPVDTAEEFLDILHSSPSLLIEPLGWAGMQIIAARKRLVKQLKGHVLKIYLNPPKAPGFGAY